MSKFYRFTKFAFLWITLGIPASLFAQTPSSLSLSQPNVTLEFGGTMQGRFSYGATLFDASGERRKRLGFGVRRARIRLRATIAKRTGIYMQLDGGGSIEMVDVFGFYQLTDKMRLRLGRFTSAQPRSFQGTSHTRIDAVNRAAIAQLWGRRTIGSDGRDFGLDLHYETPCGEAMLALQNGDGNWGRLRGNFREDLVDGDPTGSTEDTGLAVGAYGAYEVAPGLEVGGYAGYNADENPNTQASGQGRSYFSYAGHLYWGARPGSQPLRFKADLIGIRFEDDVTPPTSQGPFEQHTLGASLLGAMRPHRAGELFARYEQYAPRLDTDRRDHYVTAGGSFSLSALQGHPYRQQRLTLAYGTVAKRSSFEDRPHLFMLQVQLLF